MTIAERLFGRDQLTEDDYEIAIRLKETERLICKRIGFDTALKRKIALPFIVGALLGLILSIVLKSGVVFWSVMVVYLTVRVALETIGRRPTEEEIDHRRVKLAEVEHKLEVWSRF